MHLAVVGLGAIGGWTAARLAASGVTVTAVARGERLDLVREHGLRAIREGEERTVRLAGAYASPDDLVAAHGHPDLVLLSVKSQALAQVAGTVAALLSPAGAAGEDATTVISATNGLPWWFPLGVPGGESLVLPSADPDGVIARSIPSERIVGSVVNMSVVTPDLRTVESVAAERWAFGSITREPDPRAAAVGALFEAAGFRVDVEPVIQRSIFAKLWGNLTMNPLAGITGAGLGTIGQDPYLEAFALRCMGELTAIATALGFAITESPQERIDGIKRLGGFRTSMGADVDAGRSVELDAIVTNVVDLGHQIGVDIPHLETLLGIARVTFHERGLY